VYLKPPYVEKKRLNSHHDYKSHHSHPSADQNVW
jgi:hypothetical protein